MNNFIYDSFRYTNDYARTVFVSLMWNIMYVYSYVEMKSEPYMKALYEHIKPSLNVSLLESLQTNNNKQNEDKIEDITQLIQNIMKEQDENKHGQTDVEETCDANVITSNTTQGLCSEQSVHPKSE